MPQDKESYARDNESYAPTGEFSKMVSILSPGQMTHAHMIWSTLDPENFAMKHD